MALTNGLLLKEQNVNVEDGENVEQQRPKLIDFYPFAYALFDECLGTHCWYCLDEQRKHKRCTGCQRAFFCDKHCQLLAWKDHKFECRGIKSNGGNVPDIEVRLLGRIVARHKAILCGLDKKDPDFYTDRSSRRAIMDIWAHTKSIEKDEYAMRKFEAIYGRLCDFYDSKALLNKQTVFELHCRDFINRHAISDRHYLREIGKGLYLDLCAYDHSCSPNTVYSCRSFIATLRPLNSQVNLLDRSATFYAYIDLLCAKQDRRKMLKDTWYFNCECERCMDEGEHLLTAMLCPNCQQHQQQKERQSKDDEGQSSSSTAAVVNVQPLCIFGHSEYKDSETQMITCPQCGKIIEKEEVLGAISAMRFISDVLEKTRLEQMAKKEAVEFLENLLQKFGQILPPVNVYMCKIVQALLPLVNEDDSKRLLELHLLVEECIRICYPPNHPALAFHLRNIGIFAKAVGNRPLALQYLREAKGMFMFVMGPEHSLSELTEEILREVEAMKEEEKEEMRTNGHGYKQDIKEEKKKPSMQKQPRKGEDNMKEEEEGVEAEGKGKKKWKGKKEENGKKLGEEVKGEENYMETNEDKMINEDFGENDVAEVMKEEKDKLFSRKNEEEKEEEAGKSRKRKNKKNKRKHERRQEKKEEEEEKERQVPKEEDVPMTDMDIPKIIEVPSIPVPQIELPTLPALVVDAIEEENIVPPCQPTLLVPPILLEVDCANEGKEEEEMVIRPNGEEEFVPQELCLQIGHRPASGLSICSIGSSTLALNSPNSLSPSSGADGGSGSHSPGGSGVRKKLQSKKSSPRARTPMYPRANGNGQEGGSAAIGEEEATQKADKEGGGEIVEDIGKEGLAMKDDEERQSKEGNEEAMRKMEEEEKRKQTQADNEKDPDKSGEDLKEEADSKEAEEMKKPLEDMMKANRDEIRIKQEEKQSLEEAEESTKVEENMKNGKKEQPNKMDSEIPLIDADENDELRKEEAAGNNGNNNEGWQTQQKRRNRKLATNAKNHQTAK